jgi:hypothetical protein
MAHNNPEQIFLTRLGQMNLVEFASFPPPKTKAFKGASRGRGTAAQEKPRKQIPPGFLTEQLQTVTNSDNGRDPNGDGGTNDGRDDSGQCQYLPDLLERRSLLHSPSMPIVPMQRQML